MFTKISELLPANRVVALIGFCGALAAALGTLQTSFVAGSPPAEAIGKGIAFLGAMGLALGTVLKFLEGAQNSESLMTSGLPKVKGLTVNNVHNFTPAEGRNLEIPGHSQSAAVGRTVAVPNGMTEQEAAARLAGFAE